MTPAQITAVFLGTYGILLVVSIPLIFRATRMLGSPHWPWWLFQLALAGVAVDRLSGAVAIARGADPPMGPVAAAMYTFVGVAIVGGAVGLQRFIRDWYDDRERRFQRSIWSSLTEVYLLDPRYLMVLDQNQGADARLPREGPSASFEDLLASPPDVFRESLEPLRRGERESVEVNAELRGEGRPRPVRITVQRTRQEERTPGERREVWAAFVTDRTAEREAERLLMDQAERFRLMTESIDEGIILIDLEGRILYESPQVGPLLGVNPSERVGGHILDHMVGHDRQDIVSRVARLASGEVRALEGTEEFVRPDTGATIHLEFRARKVEFPGAGSSILLSCRDVTRRVRSERRRREQESRLRQRQRRIATLSRSRALREGRVERFAAQVADAAVRELPVARGSVWLLRADGSALDCVALETSNRSGSDPGRRDGTLAPMRVAEECPRYFAALEEFRVVESADALHDPRTAELAEAYLEPVGIGAVLDAVIRAGDLAGVVCAEHVGGTREWTPEDVSFLSELADLVAVALQEQRRREADRERSLMAAQLRVAQRMETLGVMAGGIAHDFNNLLTPILGYAEMALEEMPEDERSATPLAEIRSAGERAQALVRQLLTFSRQVEQEREPVNVGDLLREVLRLARATLPSTIEIRTDIEHVLPPVTGDSSQLHQVFMNLLANAGYAMRERGGTLSVTLDRWSAGDAEETDAMGIVPGEYARITVRDDGEGMDAATLERIFEPFFTTKPTGEGTGLGMAVTHGIVLSHRGTILVESEPGEGTAVDVLLPLSGAVPQDLEAGPDAGIIDTPGLDVLVVDDEPAVARFVSRVLERGGLTVHTFMASRDAAEAVEAGSVVPDLMITDQTMPGLTGLQLVERVRQVHPTLPVVIMSGYDTALDGPALSAARVDRFLRKPFRAQELMTAVAELPRAEPASGEPDR